MAVAERSALHGDYLLGRELSGFFEGLSDSATVGIILGLHMVEERLAKLETKVEMLSNELAKVSDAVYQTRDYIMELRGRHQRNGHNSAAVEALKIIVIVSLSGLLALVGVKIGFPGG